MDHKNCPVCKTELKVVAFNAKVWKDCIPCGKTLEELIEIAKATPPAAPRQETEHEYTKLLEALSKEVFDDFLHYM